MTKNTVKYKEITKSLALFSSVKVIQIFLGIIRNKVLAVITGPEGIGIIGILNNTISLIQSGASLGISRSAVRDIAEAKSSNEIKTISKTISLTNQVVRYTSIFGLVVTIVFANKLSIWTFGNTEYSFAYVFLGFAVALNILTEGNNAVLSGMRELKLLAKASSIGYLFGLILSVPLFLLYGNNGIVPSIILSSLALFLTTNLFLKRVHFEKVKFALNILAKEATYMIKMGIMLMFVGFLGILFDLIISTYLRSNGGLQLLGNYKAGTTIITSYFGIILTAMTTDYFPRISAVHNNNVKLEDELNKQSEIGLLLMFPISAFFVYASPIIIPILYSSNFSLTINYTDFAMLGVIVAICSNSMGMILLAKRASKLFLTYSVLHQLVFIFIYILLYRKLELLGLGLAYFINSIVQFSSYLIINKYWYNINLNKTVIRHLLIIVVTSIIAIYGKKTNNDVVYYIIATFIVVFTISYSYVHLKHIIQFNIMDYFFRKQKKNQ